MNARTIGGVLVLILLVGVVMYTRLGEAGDSGEAAKADVMVLVAEIEGYEAHKKYLDPCADLAHSAAFAKSFKKGTRREASEFHQEVYMSEFFEHLINQTRNAGHQDLVKSLMALRDKYSIPRPAGE